MMGITEGRKNLDYNQTEICSVCGRYGRFHAFMTYTVLSPFFIPCFKWNRHYYVQTSCCNTLYELDREMGRRMERGEDVRILPEHLKIVGNGKSAHHYSGCVNAVRIVVTRNNAKHLVFCPKCVHEIMMHVEINSMIFLEEIVPVFPRTPMTSTFNIRIQ
ncbi:MAG: zinc ribbon domain-containing protein [Eubacterium ramulus]